MKNKNRSLKRKWEFSTGTQVVNFFDQSDGSNILLSVPNCRFANAINTDPLKNRQSTFGKGMKKAFVKLNLRQRGLIQ